MTPEHDSQQQRFSLSFPEGEAVLDYELRDQTVVFTHTFVPPALRGFGAAPALVRTGLEWARAKGYRVEATCSYVVAYLARENGRR